jgi:GNAT superfamily N-acetyltransferase
MSITIARARTAAHCAPVRALVEAHARYERSTAAPPPDWAQQIAALIATGRIDLFVAVAGGTPIGYASMTQDVSTWTGKTYGHLDCIYLEETQRGQGVGRLLLAAVADHARWLGHAELQWQTPSWNSRAITFYRRLGAVGHAKQRFSLALD